MNWLVIGHNTKGDPYPFEASTVRGDTRKAISRYLEQLSTKSEVGLEKYRTAMRKPGLYLLLWVEGEDIHLAGFWGKFGSSYLSDGTRGAPDRDPPYADKILEALTEEVWWKNSQLQVFPFKSNTWQPIILFEWPSELAYRSAMAPPGLPISKEEFATASEAELGAEFWLERFEEEIDEPKAEGEQVAAVDEWRDLSINRSLVMILKGKLQYSRVAHESAYHMVHPQFLGDPNLQTPLKLTNWLDELVGMNAFPVSEESQHFLGQPLELLDGRVGFPMSGWLTKSLSIWPMYPKDIRHVGMTPRDVGSKALAQLKQAAGISVLVLSVIGSLAFAVQEATKPRLKAAPNMAPPEVQPALSLCSADHEKFLEEFRCQIRAYAQNPDTDKPFCGDQNSNNPGISLAEDFENLQAVYCGIHHRKDDLWVWGKEGEGGYTFGELAATKACFNVLGYPFEYRSKKEYIGKDGQRLVLPEPKAFLNGQYTINQLANLLTDLDIACTTLKERTEMQVRGSVFASLVGAESTGREGRREEPAQLRALTAEKAMMGQKADLAKCFKTGLIQNPYDPRDSLSLCDGSLREKELLIWQKLDRRFERSEEQLSVCDEPDGQIPTRNLKSCSMLSQYERARFGTDDGHDEDSKPDKLWRCHIDLSRRDPPEKKLVTTYWDLSLPVPSNYNIGGAGVMRQIALDAGLRVFAEGNATAAKDLGPCWDVVSKQLSRYEPVHPILADLEAEGWPTDEQQLCGQVCAAYFRFQRTDSRVSSEWKTPKQDLDACIHRGEPGTFTSNSRGRLDRLLLPWNYDRNDQWVTPSYEQICAFNLIAQGYMPDGYLPGELAPPVWAGDTNSTSRIAGDKDGPAVNAVQSLSRYGRPRSRSTCGYAASQCFASLMVDVMGTDSNQPSEWQVKLDQAILDIRQTRPQELEQTNPWCKHVQPYMGISGDLPEGQIDYPCAKGVDDAQQNAMLAIVDLSRGYGAE
ncbi:MAG: hypothetical protein VXZ96_08295 [Myxococcota bacterium]|nr:hypothetical protein [Myxococcota bacterium]